MMDQDGDPRNYDPNADEFDYNQYVDPPPPPPASYPGAQQTPDGVPGNQWGLPIPSDNAPGYQDLSYWLQQGHTPTGNDASIFDSNGQLRPGWKRTANGYEQVAAAPPVDPYAGGGGGYSGGGGSGLSKAGSGPDYSQMLPFSPYHAMGAFSPSVGKFSYEAFKPTSETDLENQPGYADGQKRLQKQIEGGAAYRGMLRSGMTLGDLWNGLDTNKQQRFSEFDNRRFRDYSANRDNAFGAWNANYGMDRDIYDRGATENDRANNYQFNSDSASFSAALDKWKTMVGSLTNIATAGNP